MEEKDLKKLREQTEVYKKVATARIYATDKEIYDTICKACARRSHKVQSKTYPFKTALKKN